VHKGSPLLSAQAYSSVNTHTPNTICGLLLAGGQGRRMGGVDKGLIDWRGLPLAQRAFDRLKAQTGTILISANRSFDLWQRFGVPVIPDSPDDAHFRGPLAGVLAGLGASSCPWLAIAPCDVPFLPLDLVQRLYAGLQQAATPAAVARCAHRLHPTFMLLNRCVQPLLEDFMATGQRQLSRWVAAVGAIVVDFDDPEAFINVNTPADFASILHRDTA
jgi:molybdopterin-guanine dinucleotide biosynthesis protein A